MLAPPLPAIPGYRILRRLGAGASGTVFHAIQEGTDREVALKLFEPVDHPDATRPEDVDRERRVAASLRHRNLARIHAIGDYGDQRWLACEFLAGGTLSQRIAMRMPLAQVLDVVCDIARGLGHVHARGIVHGDVKPANVLFRGGRDPRTANDAVLVDYGVAVFATDGRTTMQGGTPDYMSPEQARGGVIDGRSDFYSLGVTLHEMLVGRVPLRDGNGELPSHRAIPRLPDRVHWLQPLLDTLLAEDPAERPDDTGALLDMLASLRLASPEAAVLDPAPRDEGLPRTYGVDATPSSLRAWRWLALVLALAIGAAFAGWLLR
ncbi:serine/threonine-protein kinase [Xanthomonadaceae bacterium XH05]|nr:serine/threonine-protein kinase [Xanthomonadaceae bacterium XH05]